MKRMKFGLKVVETKEDLSTVEAPLLNLVEDPNDCKVKLQSAFFPICPIEKSFKASLNNNVDETNSNISSQSAIVVMRSRISVPPSASLKTTLFQTASHRK